MNRIASRVMLLPAAALGLVSCSTIKKVVTPIAEVVAPPRYEGGVAIENILLSSDPADGARVPPLQVIRIWLVPGATLDEVTMIGPRGMEPIIIDTANVSGYYAFTYSALDAADYQIKWRATSGGCQREGTIRFRVG
ncbi:MAG TPA: copper resistance protein CopC [Sphingomicrobium sp.]